MTSHRSLHRYLMTMFLCATAWVCPTWAADQDALLGLISADSFSVVVVPHPKSFDRRIGTLLKDAGLKLPDQGIQALVRTIPVVGSWFDAAFPIALAWAGTSPTSPVVAWGRIPKFEDRIKAVAGAKHEAGVWKLERAGNSSGSGAPTTYLKQVGDFVMAAPTLELLQSTSPCRESLAQVLASKRRSWDGRDFVLWVRFDPFRESALAGLKNLELMIPGLAMLAARSSGGDAASTNNMMTIAVEAARELALQAEDLELSITFLSPRVHLGFAAGFKEGPIRSFLSSAKPANFPFFQDWPNQEFTLAFATHRSEGGDSPLQWAMRRSTNSSDVKTAENAKSSLELLQSVRGEEVIVMHRSGGLEAVGRYIADDAAKTLRLVRNTLEQQNASAVTTGVTYHRLETPPLEGASRERFRIAVDSTHAATGALGEILGLDPILTLRTEPRGVAFELKSGEGSAEQPVSRSGKAFSHRQSVVDAMAKIPQGAQAVLMLHPDAVMKLLPNNLSPKKSPSAPDQSVLSASLFLAQEQVRVDVSIPIKAWTDILRLAQAPADAP